MRQYFPFFQNNPELIYLDSAATSQKPKCVIEGVKKYLESVANPGRSDFGLSLEIENKIEYARDTISTFFGSNQSCFAFTKGATDGMNIICQSFAPDLLNNLDEIMICDQDHKSTILPWINLVDTLNSSGKKVTLIKYKLDPFTGLIDQKDLLSKVSSKTKFIILTHSHNIYGMINPIKTICDKLPMQIIKILDSAQTVGHTRVNIKDLNVDAIIFSGHKVFALEGIGGLIVSQRIKEKFKQINFGGGINQLVFPNILEVGTKNTTAIISLLEAVNFLELVGVENIENNTKNLVDYLIYKLSDLDEVEFLAGAAYDSNTGNTGIVSFQIKKPYDELKYLFSQNNINLRLGNHCTNINIDSIRVSLHCYNNFQDIDKLIEILK